MLGKFITFEGIEGCGKSTQLVQLGNWMESIGLPFIATREPGGTELGRRVREVLLSPFGGKIVPVAELLLFEADRAQHVREVIRPALEKGVNVLCDRFGDSTLAYQAFGRGLPEEKIRELNAWATEGLIPDLTILLDIEPSEGLRRVVGDYKAGQSVQLLLFAREGGARPIRERPSSRVREAVGLDSMEAEALEFHERVRQGFLTLARRESGRFRIISPGTIEETHARVVEAVKEAFGWAGRTSAAKTRP